MKDKSCCYCNKLDSLYEILAFLLANSCITAPASIKSIQPSGSLSIEKGSAVTLKCNVTGYPHPDIVWKKLVSKCLS
jgi:hypothetical protein